MNISTGGPHILLFERDQQLTALLMSELQLAGYECHVARTAVEVFDAIARYPIRLVLVNLAQAAASRREFWVALDTQRRGRGVQVFTFQCTNLAGYGPQSLEDRTPTMADMHIDGMLGLMNLVEAVRARVPGTGGTTNTMPFPSKTIVSTPSSVASMGNTSTQSTTSNSTSYSAVRAGMTAESRTVRASMSAPAPGLPPQAQVLSPTLSTPSPLENASREAGPGQQSYTDRIHAVLYPAPRTRAQQPTVSTVETEQPAYNNTYATPVTPPADLSTLQRLANGQSNGNESSLAQLSRLVQESRPPIEEERRTYQSQQPRAQAEAAISPAPVFEQSVHTIAPSADLTATQNREVIDRQALRASPIQDLPFERSERGTASATSHVSVEADDGHRRDGLPYSNYGQLHITTIASTNPSPLASIAAATAAPIQDVPQQKIEVREQSPIQSALSEAPVQAAWQQEKTLEMRRQRQASEPQIEEVEDVQRAYEQVKPYTQPVPDTNTVAYVSPSPREAVEAAQDHSSESLIASLAVKALNTPTNALLLDIVQSLPPMPALPPQPQALNGRATRSLGSVLLEGHLVPQNRLEVAQGIQRMLSGVDLNYQLGEILLMFKLLTPDQLLAASLVSYGMITTQQIAALGRIRQELHAIGLEYDLENLVILFRILTPEQLREARASWQS